MYWDYRLRRALLNTGGKAASKAGPGPGAALDLGCGTLRLARGLMRRGLMACAPQARLVGLDLSPAMLAAGRSRLTPAEERESPAEYADLNALLAQADFVSLHVPLSKETRHLIGATELSRMKPTACLINTARGPVVDEVALLAALQRGMIAGAGLDVYENEPALTPGLADLPNVVLLPHVGSATLETRTAMAAMAARNLIDGLGGQRPPNLVNPEVLPPAR